MEETESLSTANDPESPAKTSRLMEEVCERENLKEALRRVKANKGSAGVDGITIGGITDYLKQHWPAIREQLLNGTYEPKPVRRVEIPKPDGGVRKLGIPTVLDRFIQQAVMQVLQRQWDPTFSASSYGVPTGTVGSAGRAQAAIHRRRVLLVCVRSRSGEVLRYESMVRRSGASWLREGSGSVQAASPGDHARCKGVEHG